MNEIKSVNLHVTDACNYHCKFCFSSGRNCSGPGTIGIDRWKEIIADLIIDKGIEKINFVGGEPMMYPHLDGLLSYSKSMGAVTSVVTNGSLVDKEFFVRNYDIVDWLGLSVDSTDDYTEVMLGRHSKGCRHLENVRTASALAHDFGVKLKLNITVNRQCYFEDFSGLIRELDPDRVKFMQLSRIAGINDRAYSQLSLTNALFEEFRKRHSGIVLSNGSVPVFETEDDISNSYLMIDKSGHIRLDGPNGHSFKEYDAYWDGDSGFKVDSEKYIKRGGIYEWNTERKGIDDGGQ